MIRDELYAAIQPPFDQLVEFRPQLLELSQEYPWFNAAHIFLAKADHVAGHVDYNAHLRLASLHSYDRKELWELIVKAKLQETVSLIEEEIENVALSEEELEGTVDIIPEQANKEEASSVFAVDEDVIQGEKQIEAEPEFSVEDEEEARVVKADEFDDLQREIILEAISSTIEMEQTDEESASVQEEKQTNIEVQDESEPVAAITPTENLSAFAKFLLKKADETHWEEEKRKVQRPISPSPQEEKEDNPVENSYENLDPREKQHSLIEDFIKKDPKITPGKSEEYTTENLAKKSIVEDENLVTETIAQIYAQQGAYKKALKAYKLLSLKFPEKSIYFANQIKKLQESRKSKK